MILTQPNEKFNEILVVHDNEDWIWRLAHASLTDSRREFVRIPTSTPIRQSWKRFKNAERVIIYWESKKRSGGAITEEILDISPHFDTGEKIIVLTTNATREDVVYFNELGIRRIVTIRNRTKDLEVATREILAHIDQPSTKDRVERTWQRVQYAIDTMPENASEEHLVTIETTLKKIQSIQGYSARWYDAYASLQAMKGNYSEALNYWLKSLEMNPNHFRTYNNLINFHRKCENHSEAIGLLKKMHELNKSNISRLVSMGEVHQSLFDSERAEFFFKSALDRDSLCAGALNGLAEIKFNQGHIDEARNLLSKSHLAYKSASNFNQKGIDLVRLGQFEEALEHYTKAQYVLPQQEKGPMLFYNIGLCYFKWGKAGTATEFLKIALIKEPNYKKAKRLLDAINKDKDLKSA